MESRTIETVAKHDVKVSSLETDMKEVKEEVKELSKFFTKLFSKVDKIQTTLDDDKKEQSKLTKRMSRVEKIMDRLIYGFIGITATMGVIWGLIKAFGTKLAALVAL